MELNDESIKVVIRVRPRNDKELHEKACVNIDKNSLQLDLKSELKGFTFDYVAGEATSQKEMNEIIGKPLTETCLKGINTTIFAYGQTGAGKTHTILGSLEVSEQAGLMPNIFTELQKKIKGLTELNEICFVRCSYLEIYNERIFDLLDLTAKDLQLRENSKRGVYVEGLTEESVESKRICSKFFRGGPRTDMLERQR